MGFSKTWLAYRNLAIIVNTWFCTAGRPFVDIMETAANNYLNDAVHAVQSDSFKGVFVSTGFPFIKAPDFQRKPRDLP